MTSKGISEQNRLVLEQIHREFSEPFTAEDVETRLGIDRSRARRLVRYLADRGWLDRVRRGMYLPVPLDAHRSGTAYQDPWIVGSVLFEPAYVAGWSAAEHWDLTEQIFRTVLMATAQRPRDRRPTIGGTTFDLHTVPVEKHHGLAAVWREGTRIDVTDPSKTIVDLVSSPTWGGGIRSVAEILDEYLHSSQRDDELLLKYGDLVGNGAAFKRLGYLVDRSNVDAAHLIRSCRARLTKGVSDLDPSVDRRGGIHSGWGLRLNVDLDRERLARS